MKNLFSLLGLSLVILYIILFLFINFSLLGQNNRISSNGFPSELSGMSFRSATTRDIGKMKRLIIPWGYMLDGWNTELAEKASFQEINKTSYNPFYSTYIPKDIAGFFYMFLFINAVLLYSIGYGIERLIKNRKTQPSSYAKASEDETPNQGQSPK